MTTLSKMIRAVPFTDLGTAPLTVDAAYEGGRKGNAGDDPFSPLLKVSSSGGFRYRGNLDDLKMVVLTSSLADPNWPDTLDRELGIYTYFGDNKKPGVELHKTPRKGNELLKRVFENAQAGKEGRKRVPPIFIFENTGEWRDVVFRGLAIPDTLGVNSSEDLVAIWKIISGLRFQNYRARFTIIDEQCITREWIDDIVAGNIHTHNAPKQWTKWIESGKANPLVAAPSIEYRTKSEQIPSDKNGIAIIHTIQSHFSKRPHLFEACAASISRMLLPEIISIDLTRPSKDGGRDAIGYLRVGTGIASISIDFAMEAKCYALKNGAGVKEMSRLISRLRHRQFGIFVTTSYLGLQAYQEIKEDRHPIIVLAAIDIVNLLRQAGYSDSKSVRTWLEVQFPTATASLPAN